MMQEWGQGIEWPTMQLSSKQQTSLYTPRGPMSATQNGSTHAGSICNMPAQHLCQYASIIACYAFLFTNAGII